MHGRRTPRLRALAVGLACGLVFAVGCSSKVSQPTGGSTSSKADKARKDAEALALSAFTGAADAQAKAVPELAARRDPGLSGQVVIAQKPAHVSVSATQSAPATPPPAPVIAQVPPPPAAVAPSPAPAVSGVPRMVTPQRPSSPAVVREHVVSIVSQTEAEADADALSQARDLIEKKLAELDPPVRYRPSATEVKAEFVRKDSRVSREPDAEKKKRFAEEGITGNLTVVEYDVEVTAEQVRELRSQERAAAGLRLLGVLVAGALAGFLFLRADEWTKGYLTSWLALGAVALAGGAAALLICV